MAEYVLESRTKSGAYLATLPFRDLQGEFYYSKTRALRWTMSLTSLNSFTINDFYPANTEVILYRDGVKIFTGPLWDINISKNDSKATFMAEDLSSYFDRRRISTPVAMADTTCNMAWQMIAASQAEPNGNLGITRGTVGASPAGTFTPELHMMLDKALESVYEGENGFDWVITADRIYNQYYPRIQSRANVRLEFGGNVASYSINIQGKYTANDVVTVGKNKTFTTAAKDTNSQAVYGLMQHVQSFTSTDNLPLLENYNAGVLALRAAPKDIPQLVLRTPEVNPFANDVTYGQVVRTVIDDGWVQYDRDMRCTGFQLTVGKHGNEKFNLFLNDLREVV